MEENRIRNNRIYCRLDDDEYELFLKKFKSSGLNTKEKFIRKAIFESKIFVVDFSPVREMNFQLQQIGNNINQAVRIANTEKSISSETIKKLQRRLDEIWQLQSQFVSKVR